MANGTAGRVLVTGASGFIGKAVCEYLRRRGYSVRALTRPASRWTGHAEIERVIGDMQDLQSLTAATSEVDWVAHLAAAKSDEPDSHRTNVEGAQNLVQACRASGVKCIINLSTQSAKLQRKGLYARTKSDADAVFMGSGFPVTTLRSSLVYGDKESGAFGSLVRFSRLPIIPVMGHGTGGHWPIHVEDLAQAIELAWQRTEARGRIYDVGGEQRASTNELLDMLAGLQGLKRSKFHVPVWVGLLAAWVFSVLPRPPFTRSNVLGSNEDVPMDVKRFHSDFGFAPRPLSVGMAELFAAQGTGS